MSFCLRISCTPPPPRQHVQVKNPYLDTMEEDILYHFSLGTKTHNLPEMFGDIKVRNMLDFRNTKWAFLEARPILIFSPIVCVYGGQRQPNEVLCPVHAPGAEAVWEPRRDPGYLCGNRPLLHV